LVSRWQATAEAILEWRKKGGDSLFEFRKKKSLIDFDDAVRQRESTGSPVTLRNPNNQTLECGIWYVAGSIPAIKDTEEMAKSQRT